MNSSGSLYHFFNLFTFDGIREWIRKEIVDDDPCDTETIFSVAQPAEHLRSASPIKPSIQ